MPTHDGQVFCDYSRPLGNTEENWLRAVNGGTGNTVVGVLVSMEVTREALQNAVNSVQKKHPRLLSQLVFVNGRPHFQTTSNGVVEVEVIENIPDSIAASFDGNGEGSEEFLDDSFEIGRRCSIDGGGGKVVAEEEVMERSESGRSGFKMSLCQDHWLRIVESAMNEPWKCDESSIGDEAASLLCFRMYRLHEGRSLILFRAHTSVCDRKSAGIIVEDLLSFLDDEINGGGIRPDIGSTNECSENGLNSKGNDQFATSQKAELPTPTLKDVESCIPPELSRKPFWAHGLDVVGYGLNSRRYSWLPFHDSSSERQSALVRSGLSRSDTERLKQACEKHNITIFGAVACAALKAVASVKELGHKGEHYAVTTFLDCRPLLSHEITLDTVGFYHSAMMHTHQVSETTEFWNLAKRCHESTLHAIKNRKHFTDMGDLNMLMAQAILHPQLTPESSLRTSTVCSFWDALHEKMQRFVERLGVEDYVGCSSVHGVGPLIARVRDERQGSASGTMTGSTEAEAQKESTTAQDTNAEATPTPMDASAADTDSPAAATGEDKPAAKDGAAVEDKPASDAAPAAPAPAAAAAGAGAESKEGEGGADKAEGGEGEEKKTAAFSPAVRAEILRQVEYYLSDSNLPRDRFMQEKLQEGNGFVPLALLCTFSRMRKHLGVLPDAPVPAHLVRATYEVLKASTFLKFSDDGKLVGREGEVALGKERIAEINARSLYAEPFQWNSTLDDLHAFFTSLGPVKSVCMRRHPASKAFKGSVYVEFDSEHAMRLVAAKKDVKFNGATLLLQPKNEWLQQAREEWQKRVAEKGEEAGRFEAEDGDMDLRPPAKARRVEEGGEGGAEGEGGEGAEAEEEGDEEEEEAYPKGLILGYTIAVADSGDGEKGKGEGKAEGEKDGVGNGEVKGEEGKKEGEEGKSEGEENGEEKKVGDEEMADAAEAEKKAEEEGKKAEEDAKEVEKEKEQEKEGEKVEGAAAEKGDEKKEEEEKKDGVKAEEKAEEKAEGEKKDAEGEALGKRKREESVVAEGVTREECRFVFEKFGIVKFVEYKAGDLTGFIRFETPEGPIKASNKAKSAPAALTIKGYPVTVHILEGEEEAAYWSKLRDGQKKRKDFGGRFGGGGGFRLPSLYISSSHSNHRVALALILNRLSVALPPPPITHFVAVTRASNRPPSPLPSPSPSRSPLTSRRHSSLVALPHSCRQFATPSPFLSLAALPVSRRPSSPVALLLSPPAALASHRDRVPTTLPSPSVPPFVIYYLPSRRSSSLPSPPVDPSSGPRSRGLALSHPFLPPSLSPLPFRGPRSLPSLSAALALSPPFLSPSLSPLPFSCPCSLPSLSVALALSPPFPSPSFPPLPFRRPRSLPSLSAALALSPPFPSPSLSLIPFCRPRSLPSLSVALALSPPFPSPSLSPLPFRRPRSLPSLSLALALSHPFPSPSFSPLPFRCPHSLPPLSAALALSPPFPSPSFSPLPFR
ncbi:unnamed protein product [Closterium sp. Yama58-4]|nr:unnamed protein product [Closterium sp. Yama58-4]